MGHDYVTWEVLSEHPYNHYHHRMMMDMQKRDMALFLCENEKDGV